MANRASSTPPKAVLFIALAALLLALLVAATPGPGAAAARGLAAPACGNSGVEFLGFSDALNKMTFGGANVGGLSSLTYDRGRDVYYSLVDNERETPARFYTLRIPLGSESLGAPRVLEVATLRDASGQPFTGANFDGEGIALTPGGELLISSETEPSIRRFGLDGQLLGELPVPERFRVAPAGEARNNQTFESLALGLGGRTLFTAVEGPLAPDGATADGRLRIRILRYDAGGAGDFAPAAQHFYLTEPAQGVAEIAAPSERELLVLERGFVQGSGNTVRVYRVSLDGAADLSGAASLDAPGLAPVAKELLFDLADCPPSGATNPQPQANPLLDNFESLALGPRLADGRQALLLQSDDNFGQGQVTRVVAVSVAAAPSLPNTGAGRAGGIAGRGPWLGATAVALLIAAGAGVGYSRTGRRWQGSR